MSPIETVYSPSTGGSIVIKLPPSNEYSTIDSFVVKTYSCANVQFPFVIIGIVAIFAINVALTSVATFPAASLTLYFTTISLTSVNSVLAAVKSANKVVPSAL